MAAAPKPVKDWTSKEIGLGKDAQSFEEAYQKTAEYLKDPERYPNGRLKLKGKKAIIKQRFDKFHEETGGVDPPAHLFLVEQVHIAEDPRFWLIGRQAGPDLAQYINPNGLERDGDASMSMIHIMAIPRNDNLSVQKPIYNGVAFNADNVDLLEHMKTTFKNWWSMKPTAKDPEAKEAKQIRNYIIWHQARTILRRYREQVKKMDGLDGMQDLEQLNMKGAAGTDLHTFLRIQEEKKRLGMSKPSETRQEIRIQDMVKWDKFLQILVMHLGGRARVMKNPALALDKLPWNHPANMLVKAYQHYVELKYWFEEGWIKADDFDFALHLRPDNSVDYLHMHIYLAPNRFRMYNSVIWDPLYKSVDEVIEIAKLYPGGGGTPEDKKKTKKKQAAIQADAAAGAHGQPEQSQHKKPTTTASGKSTLPARTKEPPAGAATADAPSATKSGTTAKRVAIQAKVTDKKADSREGRVGLPSPLKVMCLFGVWCESLRGSPTPCVM
ncbi:hypothetical protein B0H63DRAFT_550907 [Podospora didyma]|uniref:Uncharacterized protein n=1 Tax=Podospora didyma TaxID=330526 RepID=A0AAE0N694_9PEZI|nr:hypothetical protein B0H63DRAFT_550907 [Podospora didyma]